MRGLFQEVSHVFITIGIVCYTAGEVTAKPPVLELLVASAAICFNGLSSGHARGAPLEGGRVVYNTQV